MRTSIRHRLVASAVAGALLTAAALPVITLGTVTGGCTATGTSTSGGSIDLTTATEWHLNSKDTAGGSGTAPTKQTSATVSAYFLGLAIPIVSGSGDGDTAGSVEGVSVSTFALIGSRFLVSGSSSTCSGKVLVIIDDVNPLLTGLGGGGIALAVLGAVLLLVAMRSGGGIGSRLAGVLFGGLGGAGLGVSLAQFGILDPASIIGLGVAGAGALLGLLVPGLLNRGPK